MIKEQKQQFNISENAEETHRENSSQKLLTNDPIKDTPFRLVGNPQQGYAITLGKFRLTEPKQTEIQALEILDTFDWNFICNVIVTTIQSYKEIENEL